MLTSSFLSLVGSFCSRALHVCRRVLLIGSQWPIAFMLVAALGCVGVEFAQSHRRNGFATFTQSNICKNVVAGLKRAQPLCLIVTFALVPSTATRIFETFLCASFEYDGRVNEARRETRRYMHNDLTLRCDSDQYAETHATALRMLFVWPVGGERWSSNSGRPE